MSGGAHIRAALLLMLICATGVAVRLAVPAADFAGGHPLPFPDDPPYHLLRVERLAGLSPSPHNEFRGCVDRPDPMIAHPYGDRCIWPWGFDRALAALVPSGGECDRDCVVHVAGLATVALSAMTAVLVFFLGIRLWRARGLESRAGTSIPLLTPMAAAAFFLFMPANVSYSLAGRVDHHVMEPIFVVLPLLLVSGSGSRRLPALAAGGLLCGLAAAFFPAAPAASLPVFAIAGLFLAGQRQVLAWCCGMMTGILISLFASPTPLEWVHYSPSLWHVTVVACLSTALLAYHAMTALARRRRLNRLSIPALGAFAGILTLFAVGGAASMLFPGLARSFADGVNYASSTNFAALSLEASSALSDPSRTMALTGWLGPLAAAGLVAVAMPGPTLRRGTGIAPFWLLSAAFFVLAAAQRRFLVAATPFIALMAAFGLDFIFHMVFRGMAKRAAPAVVAAAFLSVIVLLLPSLNTIRGMEYLSPRDRAVFAAADAIAALPGDERGTLAPWGYGHVFKYTANAPTVCDNFFGVPGADAAMHRCLSLLYETDDARIEQSLADLRIRFVVLVPPHPDQIRAETSLIGMNPADWVDADDRLSQLFARSFQGRLGLWASTATIGAPGPLGMTLRGRFRQVSPGSGRVEAEVLLLERDVPGVR